MARLAECRVAGGRDFEQRTFPCVENESECVVFGEIRLCKVCSVFRRVEYEVMQGCMRPEGSDRGIDGIVSVSVIRMGDS